MRVAIRQGVGGAGLADDERGLGLEFGFVDAKSLVGQRAVKTAHEMSAQAQHRCLQRHAVSRRAGIEGVVAIWFFVVAEITTAEDHPYDGGVFCPNAIAFDQYMGGVGVGAGIALDIADQPRLFVVTRRRPARGLENGAESFGWNGVGQVGTWRPAADENWIGVCLWSSGGGYLHRSIICYNNYWCNYNPTTVVSDLPKSTARSAHLALIQVHEAVSDEFRLLFQQFGLTATQFNVLRILVQGDPEGESCSHIGRRLIHRVPDVTRLVDRMQEHGLLERCRSQKDRRVVKICITKHGRELCETLYEPLAELEEHVMKVLNQEEQAQLDSLLRRVLAQFQTEDSA